MNVPLVDMHCHLDLYPEPAMEVARIAGLKAYVLSVTTTPKAWRVTSSLSATVPRIRTALGLHPQLAKARKSELPLFDRLLPNAKYVGEIGLDGGPDCKEFWSDQTDVFEHILSSCERLGGRILTIHSRSAATAVLDMVERYPGCGKPILHWFSGTQRELARAAEMGCWFSVGPAMLAGEKGRRLVGKMPRERVLTETDGPFACVDGQPLKPAECSEALNFLSGAWQCDVQDAAVNVLNTFRSLIVD